MVSDKLDIKREMVELRKEWKRKIKSLRKKREEKREQNLLRLESVMFVV
jgi:hypothetical protein